jgi:hypothetical protein
MMRFDDPVICQSLRNRDRDHAPILTCESRRAIALTVILQTNPRLKGVACTMRSVSRRSKDDFFT